MIVNRWNDEAARRMQDQAGTDPSARELALRVYSSRLIGGDPDLVMHGGGNTSVKLFATDVFGDNVDVLHVKGSGADLDVITAAGMPAVRMAPLLRLRALGSLSDEAMVNVQRANLMDSAAPNPSVETLLHAWLPHRYVDHTHATAFLTLANLPEVAEACAEIFGTRLTLVPYIMPGFALAKAAAAAHQASPEAEGLLLVNHGHFAWGPTARSSYDQLLAHTNAVEAWLADRRPSRLYPSAALVDPLENLAMIRGALASALAGDAALPVLDLRASEDLHGFLARPDLPSLAQRGVATPDHVIRTKGHPLLLTAATLAAGSEAIRAEVTGFVDRYRAYFARQAQRFGGAKTMLAPMPGLIWAEGLGIVGVGANAAAARIAADIGCQSSRVMSDAEGLSGFRPITESDQFDAEYWSLEQAKLGKAKPPRHQGKVVLVTGGAGAIGLATARAFAAEGAALFLVDLDADALAAAVAGLGRDHAGLACDITKPGAAAKAVADCVRRFGGLDILVSNAGAAMTGDVATLPDAVLRQSFELNFFAHQDFAQAAIAVFRAQTTARGGRVADETGQILINVSKQAVNPGRGLAAYGIPKAATFFLLRQLALELGAEGVRVNGINADRIRSGLLTDEMISVRSAARGLTEDSYMSGNLLQREVEARHVAEAFVALSAAQRTTGHVITVDGGNIEAALR